MDVTYVRRRVGMVFQKSNPFPKSIFDNVAYGLRVNGISKKSVVEEAVERSLSHAALWTEVKDKLQQARLRAFRRPAAAALHCARSGGRAGSAAAG